MAHFEVSGEEMLRIECETYTPGLWMHDYNVNPIESRSSAFKDATVTAHLVIPALRDHGQDSWKYNESVRLIMP